ncbi:MAG: hypothetical protein RIQ89_1889 [Bacteroidota bacterium]|jgi:oligoendopeptidase F
MDTSTTDTNQINFNDWKSIEPTLHYLVNYEINSIDDLTKWLQLGSAFDTACSEHAGWLYIKMTCDTQNKSLAEAYRFFVNEIQPKLAPFEDQLNKKLVESPFKNLLDATFSNHLKSVSNSIHLYREVNIPLIAQMQTLEQQYGEICGDMTILHHDKQITLQQAANLLRQNDRLLRKDVYGKIIQRRAQDKIILDQLFDQLITLRNTIAHNAGFTNFVDYKFMELDRFDYTIADCIDFHQSTATHVVPLLHELLNDRKLRLNLDKLYPYDLEVDSEGRKDLKPFENAQQLISKTIACFTDMDYYFGSVIEKLHSLHHMDLDSRIGKAPGGYNYPLYKTGVPFIFMNATGSLRDVVTMVHEGGHAIHSMLTHELPHLAHKDFPSEVAELASMSMELMSMEHWHHFFDDPIELNRAKKEQLEGVIETLPWICCIDAFQHWLYSNPNHTQEQRHNAWIKIYDQYSSSLICWEGYEDAKEIMWQKQLHLFEVPFYYIEYGMAQLGAIALWKNYKTNPKDTVAQYKRALSLGYTAGIKEIYKAAGIRFDFSPLYIKGLLDFVFEEWKKL